MYIYIDICICVYVYICIYVRVQNLRNVHASGRADCTKCDGSVEDDQEHEEQKLLDEVGVCEVPAVDAVGPDQAAEWRKKKYDGQACKGKQKYDGQANRGKKKLDEQASKRQKKYDEQASKREKKCDE